MITKDWTCKGFDLTFDGYRGWGEETKNFVLYPKGYWFSIVGVNHANSCKGTNERIKIVDNAITKAKRLT